MPILSFMLCMQWYNLDDMESDLQFYRAVGFNCYVRPLPFFFGQCKLKVVLTFNLHCHRRRSIQAGVAVTDWHCLSRAHSICSLPITTRCCGSSLTYKTCRSLSLSLSLSLSFSLSPSPSLCLCPRLATNSTHTQRHFADLLEFNLLARIAVLQLTRWLERRICCTHLTC